MEHSKKRRREENIDDDVLISSPTHQSKRTKEGFLGSVGQFMSSNIVDPIWSWFSPERPKAQSRLTSNSEESGSESQRKQQSKGGSSDKPILVLDDFEIVEDDNGEAARSEQQENCKPIKRQVGSNNKAWSGGAVPQAEPATLNGRVSGNSSHSAQTQKANTTNKIRAQLLSLNVEQTSNGGSPASHARNTFKVQQPVGRPTPKRRLRHMLTPQNHKSILPKTYKSLLRDNQGVNQSRQLYRILIDQQASDSLADVELAKKLFSTPTNIQTRLPSSSIKRADVQTPKSFPRINPKQRNDVFATLSQSLRKNMDKKRMEAEKSVSPRVVTSTPKQKKQPTMQPPNSRKGAQPPVIVLSDDEDTAEKTSSKELDIFSEEWLTNFREQVSLNRKKRDQQIEEQEKLAKLNETDTLKFLEKRDSLAAGEGKKQSRRVPAEATEKVDAALDESEDVDEYMCDTLAIRIIRNDLVTLNPGAWLNDTVISVYFRLVVDRCNSNPKLPKIWAPTTHFYSTLRDQGYQKVKRWTRKCKPNIFTLDKLLIPLHLGQHWCCGCIDFKRKRIEYYDSMNLSGRKFFEIMRAYLKQESMEKLKQEFDESDWIDFSCPSAPQQNNGYDCGVFTCQFAECLGRDVEFDFAQSDMPELRRVMAWEILSKKIMSV